jgi:hypothetical protein
MMMMGHVLLPLVLLFAAAGTECFPWTWSYSSTIGSRDRKLFARRPNHLDRLSTPLINQADRLSTPLVLDIVKAQGIPVKPVDDFSTSLPVCIPREFNNFVGRSDFFNKTEANLWAPPRAKRMRPLTTILASSGMGKSRAIDELHDLYSKTFPSTPTLFCAISYNSPSLGQPTSTEGIVAIPEFSLVSRILWSYFLPRDLERALSYSLNDFQLALYNSLRSDKWTSPQVLLDTVKILREDISARRNVSAEKVRFVLGIDELSKSNMVDPILRALLETLLLAESPSTSFLITSLSLGLIDHIRKSGRDIVFSDLTLLDKTDTFALLDEPGGLDRVPLDASWDHMSDMQMKDELKNYFYYQTAGHPRTLEVLVNQLRNFTDQYPSKKLVLSKLSYRKQTLRTDRIAASTLMEDVADRLPYSYFLPESVLLEILKSSPDVDRDNAAVSKFSEFIERGAVIATSTSAIPMATPLVIRNSILRNARARDIYPYQMLREITDAVGFDSIVDSKDAEKGRIFEKVWANVLAIRHSTYTGPKISVLPELYAGTKFNPSSFLPVGDILIPSRRFRVISRQFKNDFPNLEEVVKYRFNAQALTGAVLVPQNLQSGYDMLMSYGTPQGKPVVVLFECNVSRTHQLTDKVIMEKYRLCERLDWQSMGIESFADQVVLAFASYELHPIGIDYALLPSNVMIMDKDCLNTFAGTVLSHLCRGALWTDLRAFRTPGTPTEELPSLLK